MTLEDDAALILLTKNRQLGISELTEASAIRTQTVIQSVRRMVQEGLLELRPERTTKRGRPRKVLSVTALGRDFLETYERLKLRALRSNRNDLVKARRDAQYADRLVARGKDPYQALEELNTIVRTLKNHR